MGAVRLVFALYLTLVVAALAYAIVVGILAV
jgi:hypothetical protein